jgi:hypothetical protein
VGFRTNGRLPADDALEQFSHLETEPKTINPL